MIETLLIIIFFGYLLPSVLVYMLLASITSDEFNNMNAYQRFKWAIVIPRLDYNVTAINWVPIINLFLLFRIVFYKLFKR